MTERKEPSPRALVTGASSGLGLAISRALSARGYALTLVGRDEEKLNALAAELPGSEGYPCDLSLRAQTRALAEKLAAGDYEVLVNCAGFGLLGESSELGDAELEILEVNACAAQILTCAFLRSATAGRILNVASAAAFAPSPFFAAYAASKSYVYSWSRALSEELRAKKSRITLTTVCPGLLATPFDARAGGNPRRGMSPETCAKIALSGLFRGKPLILPGGAKWGRLAARLLPDWILVRAERRIQKRKTRKS